MSNLGTCESFFSFESNLESNRLSDSFSNRIFKSNRPYTTQAVTQPNPSVFCICDEREWCTDYRTPNCILVYFTSIIKRVKQCCCTLILLPKSTLNANLTTTNRLFTNDNWQRERFENFESDHQYELILESDVRFEIESNHEASQVPSLTVTKIVPYSLHNQQQSIFLPTFSAICEAFINCDLKI